MGSTLQRYSWLWQVMIFSISFATFHMIYDTILFAYVQNNKHRTYEAAMVRERAHKKKLR